MRTFRFNLEKVLRLRKHTEKDWEIKLGEIVSTCNNVQRKISSLEIERAENFKEFILQKNGLEYLQLAERYFSRIAVEKNSLHKELEELQQRKEKIQEEYMKASREAKVIEKLKERKAEQYYRKQMQEEIKELDDINTQGAVRSRALQV